MLSALPPVLIHFNFRAMMDCLMSATASSISLHVVSLPTDKRTAVLTRSGSTPHCSKISRLNRFHISTYCAAFMTWPSCTSNCWTSGDQHHYRLSWAWCAPSAHFNKTFITSAIFSQRRNDTTGAWTCQFSKSALPSEYEGLLSMSIFSLAVLLEIKICYLHQYQFLHQKLSSNRHFLVFIGVVIKAIFWQSPQQSWWPGLMVEAYICLGEESIFHDRSC